MAVNNQMNNSLPRLYKQKQYLKKRDDGAAPGQEDLSTILGRISTAFTKIETGMVASGSAVEGRGRAESDFDEYHETFRGVN